MKNEDIIQELEYLKSFVQNNFLALTKQKFTTALDLVIEYTKKQEPRAAKRQSMHGYTTAHCPVCNERVSWTHKYCPWCGQAVDLNKREEEE